MQQTAAAAADADADADAKVFAVSLSVMPVAANGGANSRQQMPDLLHHGCQWRLTPQRAAAGATMAR